MYGVLIRFSALTGALFLAAYLFSGVEAAGWPALFMAAFFVGLLSVMVRPVILFFTFPVNLLTLGLFGFALNVAIVWVVASVIDGYTIDGVAAAVAAGAVVSTAGVVSRRFARSDA